MREIIETDSHLVISALAGDAAAGGVPLALAADHVVAREDVVLNPYYRHMGGLYGSEYWTYLLPRRVGAEMTARLTSPPFEAVGTRRAVEIGLLDDAFGDTAHSFRAHVRRDRRAPRPQPAHAAPARREAARAPAGRAHQAAQRATAREELARSHDCFFGEDRSYHQARHRFVHKLGAPCAVTPLQAAASALKRWHRLRPARRAPQRAQRCQPHYAARRLLSRRSDGP